MKINGFGMSRTHETLRKDQDKQTKEKNGTTKPQDKGDTYSISPEARARTGAESQGTATVLPTESSQTTLPNHGETLMQELKLETAVEGKTLYLSREQIESGNNQVLEGHNPDHVRLDSPKGPKQEIEGSYSGNYDNKSWETTFPSHNPPERTGDAGQDFDNILAYNNKVRDQISDSVNKLLKDNNVVIPEGVEFDISVDPYDYKIHVTGVNGETLDPDLEKQIEDALNKGNNGKNLYEHIDYVNTRISLWNPLDEENESYLHSQLNEWNTHHSEGNAKLQLIGFLEEFSGYSMDELEHRDGGWYTPDGENAWSKSCAAFIASAPAHEKMGAYDIINNMSRLYEPFAKEGFDALEDRNLTITYSDGKLKDYGSSVGLGEGQTGWEEEVRKEYIKTIESWDKVINSIEERKQKSAAEEEAKSQAMFKENMRNTMEELYASGNTQMMMAFLEQGGEDAMREVLGDELFDKYFEKISGADNMADKIREILNGTAQTNSLLESLFPSK